MAVPCSLSRPSSQPRLHLARDMGRTDHLNFDYRRSYVDANVFDQESESINENEINEYVTESDSSVSLDDFFFYLLLVVVIPKGSSFEAILECPSCASGGDKVQGLGRLK